MASRTRPDRTEDPGDNWYSEMTDRYRTLHASFDATLDDAGFWSLLADLTWSKGDGEIWVTGFPGGSQANADVVTSIPDTDNELTVFTLAVSRKLGDAWEVGLKYWYENWEESDWQFDYFAPWVGDIPNTGLDDQQFLGRDYFDYENHIVSLMATYKF